MFMLLNIPSIRTAFLFPSSRFTTRLHKPAAVFNVILPLTFYWDLLETDCKTVLHELIDGTGVLILYILFLREYDLLHKHT